MRKKIILPILIILLTTFYIYTKSVEENFNNEISELKINLEQQDLEIQSQKEKIADYNDLINRFFSSDDDSTFDVLRRAYKVSAWVYLDDEKVPLPKNGKIYTDAKQVTLEFIVNKPPNIEHPAINEYLNSFSDLFNHFEMPTAKTYRLDEDYLSFSYGDLKVGDYKDIEMNYNLSKLLDMTSPKIQLVITDQFDKGADYMPKNIQMKKYSGGFENEDFEEYYTYLSDTTCRKDLNEIGPTKSLFYEYKDDLRTTHISKIDMTTAPFETLVLPKVIKLGATWEDDNVTQMITGVDIEIETPLGTYKAIEVTSDYTEGKNKYNKKVTYYTKELGIVYSYTFGRESEILEVKYMD